MVKRRGLSTYEETDHWRPIYGALPASVRPPHPYSVQEEYRRLAGFDVHVDRWLAPGAEVRAVMLHGVGMHGRLLGPFAYSLTLLGVEVVAPDLPGAGLTGFGDAGGLSYDDWREVAATLIRQERAKGLPLIAVGMSTGGMLAYDASTLGGGLDGLMVTALLDPTQRDVRRALMRGGLGAGFAKLLLERTPRMGAGLTLNLGSFSKLAAPVKDDTLREAIIADTTAGGVSPPFGFLRSWLHADPVTPPESFRVCPVLLAHPMADPIVPPELSAAFLARIAADNQATGLRKGGHLPFEHAALEDFDAAFGALMRAVLTGRALNVHER
jgi:alpha-beta hydrolase superfamily lysophospholipase